MALKVTLIPGDGIGLEVTSATKDVIDASGVDIEWEIVTAGSSVVPAYGAPLPQYVIESIKKNKVALKGPITTPVGKGFRSVNVALRQNLNLYANVRPIKSYAGIPSLYDNVDLIIVRENTEGLYSGVEHMVGNDASESIKIVTRKACDRIIKFAFEYAKKEGYKKVTAVHKANILKLSDGMFLQSAIESSKKYKDIQFQDMIVDAMSMKLIQQPQKYDIIVAPNLYGDILSDMAAGLVGGLGVVPGANIGDDIAVFEPVHGSAPDIAGKNIANPTATILSGIMMLKYLGKYEEAEKIETALSEVIKEGKSLTQDLGGNLGTREFANEIIKRME
ncbi:isocitrate/isopropylmalate dehydrogenase family protein [Caldisalinibacter kiritimatiensis]|uniref:Isocitrate dehydrogenase [NAD] n=1 Tax=Caldisalinibacter kiritimatiensis TaxID=1304284 RepID=R1AVP0_9FIRM|nr:isocitrate/isopropylmalate dehydrogenase family protein [Caldisalinibacter kiritimatiensis]EOD00737.1 Isocitrate dehydrogenase [NAD] [Caldisalinibacter kiritimatiensis]